MRNQFLMIPLLSMAVPSMLHGEIASFFRADGGVSADVQTHLPDDFSDAENLAWKQPLDAGHSTPCVYGDKIFLTTYRRENKELSIVALDRLSGQLLWKRVAPAAQIEATHETGSPATSTPACDGRQLYVFFGSYGLQCYDLDGKLVWEKPMGPFQDEYGSGSSPILVGDKVILNQDHDVNNFLYAFDSATGDTIWKTSRDEFTRSYATPIVWKGGGKTQIVVPGSLQLAAYDCDSGKKIWWINGLARIVIPTPAVSGDMLIAASWSPGADGGERIAMAPWEEAVAALDRDGDGKIRRAELADDSPVIPRFFRIDVDQDGGLDQTEWEKHAAVFARAQNQAIAIRPDGEGELTSAHTLWRFERGIPYVSSPVIHDGVAFLVKDGGILTSLDVRTGKLLRTGRLPGQGNYYASPVVGDGKLYAASVSGTLSVATAVGNWQVVSSHDFGESICATPVIHDGKIYVRTDAALYCYGAP